MVGDSGFGLRQVQDILHCQSCRLLSLHKSAMPVLDFMDIFAELGAAELPGLHLLKEFCHAAHAGHSKGSEREHVRPVGVGDWHWDIQDVRLEKGGYQHDVRRCSSSVILVEMLGDLVHYAIVSQCQLLDIWCLCPWP